jgi:hypothetical protein
MLWTRWTCIIPSGGRMERQLTGLNNDYYVVLATAFVHAPQARSMDILRVEATIADKLEAVSTPAENNGRKWDEKTTTLILTQQEIELLRERIPQVTWFPVAASRAIRTYDWLGTGVEVK